MSKRTITAHFSDPVEFIDELERDVDLIERRIVRLTQVTWPDASGALTHARVEAAAIVEGRVVRLVVYCGTLWGVASSDEPVRKRASELIDSITASLYSLELEPRAGRWDDE